MAPAVVVRSVLFHVAAVGAVIVFLPFAPLLLIPDRRPSRPFLAAFFRLFGRLLRTIAGIDWRVEGAENLPKGAHLVASRHESAWETLFLPLILDDPAAFAKSEIFSWPLGGLIARRAGHIAIDRGGDLAALKRAFEEARRTVAAGRSLLIFPSGTRQAQGRDRIQPGVGALYELLAVPCVPVTLDSGRCWPPDTWLKFPGTIRVVIGAPIPAGLDRRAFVAELATRLGAAGRGEG